MEKGFLLDKSLGYFQNHGVDVMAFDDIYPEGHQSGVSILMHGRRVATNGDLRFEPTPGQWQPVPKQEKRTLDEDAGSITTRLSYPDLSRHLVGFNPMIYPDFAFSYQVHVQGEGDSVLVTVDLDQPVPPEFLGKLSFNLELFPGDLFGKPWIMDNKQGIFPRQPNGPVLKCPSNLEHSGRLPAEHAAADMNWLAGYGKEFSPIVGDDLIAEPYAVGKVFTVRPDEPLYRFTVESKTADLKLYDGRMNHNNGWFVLSSEVPAGKTENAIEWVITPHVKQDWLYTPVVQTSQVGYHPDQPKVAVIELDARDSRRFSPALYRLGPQGEEEVLTHAAVPWGKFLRYHYLKFDFSAVTEEGMYRVRYGDSCSSYFRIARDVYDRGVWQPVLEYFLPVQMCHMRVTEKYRVWHDLCHNDDARMAPTDHNHFDGYRQGGDTLSKYRPGEIVPGLNAGGWHDAGDFDLRIESQAGECYILSLAFEEFGVNHDTTTIDQQRKITEIHQPDGKNDILQQIEHGLLSVLGAYRALGRPYRGIICNDLRQYVLLGDGAAMTDNLPSDDDRWVFTQELPRQDFTTAAQLAACSRAMKGFNDSLSDEALSAAKELFEKTSCSDEPERSAKIHAAVELFLTTGEEAYRTYLLENQDFVTSKINDLGWIISRAVKELGSKTFSAAVQGALMDLKQHYDELSRETPYGIPYRPHIWGAGWDIQRLGFQYYFLLKAFPEVFSADFIYNSLNFILGCHPGSNTSSFASGVGTKSATVAYGMNRADWSYIPGGVISGTALIRPDFPELLEFPFLWQQTEYVMGGGSTHYMFLVLAAQKLLGRAHTDPHGAI
ncbi:MAG: glycoside hydrolase family 9 protein [Acutalibacter sp.]|nr:glycoside hydrolase family 9 protein [Acutalibacter sp.]